MVNESRGPSDLAKLRLQLESSERLVKELEAAKAAGKPWYKSKGVIAGGIGSLLGFAGMFGLQFDLTPEEQLKLTEVILAAVGIAGVVFRAIAKTKLTRK